MAAPMLTTDVVPTKLLVVVAAAICSSDLAARVVLSPKTLPVALVVNVELRALAMSLLVVGEVRLRLFETIQSSLSLDISRRPTFEGHLFNSISYETLIPPPNANVPSTRLNRRYWKSSRLVF
jgi:hypothetical protein